MNIKIKKLHPAAVVPQYEPQVLPVSI